MNSLLGELTGKFWKMLINQWHKVFKKITEFSQLQPNVQPSTHRSDALELSYKKLLGAKPYYNEVQM